MNLGQIIDATRVLSGEHRAPPRRRVKLLASYGGKPTVFARVYAHIAAVGTATVTEIARAAGLSPGHASVTLTVLVRAGHVERVGRGVYRAKA